MNFHIAKVITTFMTSVIQLLKYVTSFTYRLNLGETPPLIMEYVNYVNMPGNCVKVPGTLGLKFITSEFFTVNDQESSERENINWLFYWLCSFNFFTFCFC